MHKGFDWRHYLLTAALLIAYSLAWSYVPTVGGFTNNATDLAEWVSIHPAVRGEPFLLTALLLRLPLLCVAWWVGAAHRRNQPLLPSLVGVALLSIALLPPFEFFTSARSDPNYQQQFTLALAALMGGIVAGFGAARFPARLQAWLRAAVLLLALAAAIGGIGRALPLLASFGLEAQWGIGALLFCAVCVVGIVASILPESKQGS